jgi:hypothetical protein
MYCFVVHLVKWIRIRIAKLRMSIRIRQNEADPIRTQIHNNNCFIYFCVLKVTSPFMLMCYVVFFFVLFRFHPTKSNCLSSGSTDGLVNVYDLNEGKVIFRIFFRSINAH